MRFARPHRLSDVALALTCSAVVVACGSPAGIEPAGNGADVSAASATDTGPVLPPTGAVTIAGVDLPAGTNVDGRYWMSDESVESATEVWLQLVRAYPETGLFPVLLEPFPVVDERLWLLTRATPPLDPQSVRSVDVLATVRDLWSGARIPPSLRGSLPAEFPALADATTVTDVEPAITARADSRYVLLASVENPGDVLAVTGWASSGMSTLQAASIIRSWYERFGALPYVLGLDTLEVASGRIPDDDENRLLLAGEIYAVGADFNLGESVSVDDVVRSLDEPTRYFWWD